MAKKNLLLGIIGIALLFGISGVLFAQWGQDVKDTYDTIPDNEYYVTVVLTSGSSQTQTVSSCAEALNLKDRALRANNCVSVTIRAKYRVHMWHDDCNKTYYK